MTPEVRQLIAGLRQLRESAGLSLTRLAERTPYSKSSWARYLNGEKPVPYDAVVALCQIAGERPERLLALWELADAEWSGRARHAPESVDVGHDGGRARRVLFAVGAFASVGLAAAVCAAVLLLPDESADSASPPPTYAPGCTGPECDGEDPVAMGCGGQSMVTSAAERTLPGGRRVELRYGKVCRAVWARGSRLRIGDRIELTRPGTRPKAVQASDRTDTLGYLATPMMAADGPDGPGASDGPGGARVCLVPVKGDRVCFGA
ncbi:helix-turn-helix domain-containing protein [Streptomyces montanus]|uniref:helix-turn-helix domain-containing protein n=1 Tax=Streptomyces montanus TaxID=2580423 RepID=UPI0014873BFA|nr:XRE family transcriptional regulator [Streptomyces montanus]